MLSFGSTLNKQKKFPWIVVTCSTKLHKHDFLKYLQLSNTQEYLITPNESKYLLWHWQKQNDTTKTREFVPSKITEKLLYLNFSSALCKYLPVFINSVNIQDYLTLDFEYISTCLHYYSERGEGFNCRAPSKATPNSDQTKFSLSDEMIWQINF